MTRLSVGELAGLAQIAVVLAILADNARIVSSGLLEFDMGADLFGNGCRVFPSFYCNGGKSFPLSESDLNGNPIAEG